MRKVKTKGKTQATRVPYPLNEFTPSIIQELCKRIVHLIAVGHKDMDGDTFCRIYADSFNAKQK